MLTSSSYEFKNKTVGVIGGGSSAIQIVPELQRLEGVNLKCFVRSKTWISQPFGEASMKKLGLSEIACRLMISSKKCVNRLTNLASSFPSTER